MSERDQFGCLPDPPAMPKVLLDRREARRTTNQPNLTQQIDWLHNHLIDHLPRTMAEKVAIGRMSQDHADHNLACARAALRTLIQLRALVRGQEIHP